MQLLICAAVIIETHCRGFVFIYFFTYVYDFVKFLTHFGKSTWTAKVYNFHVYYMLMLASGGSKGGRKGHEQLLGVQILSMSCSLWENLAKSFVGALS